MAAAWKKLRLVSDIAFPHSLRTRELAGRPGPPAACADAHSGLIAGPKAGGGDREGRVFVGAVAAVVSWGLYGPLSSYYIAVANGAVQASASKEPVGLTLATLVGAVLIGIGGARWLTAAVDEKLLRAAGAAGRMDRISLPGAG